ncbi:MAG: hypothetical protein R2798_03495 [Chitinophagales bacterium]|nr:hypothetical protein [Bacteroidota bacterium]MCB9043552.1 hypothetical protein [Chitinophagales bacterium]
MPIKYIPNNEIDFLRWDTCIAQSLLALPYAQSWYLDIVSPEWDALVYDDYEAVMPLPITKKWHIKQYFPPFFAQQLGIFSPYLLQQSLINEFAHALQQCANVYIHQQLNASNDFVWQGFSQEQRTNYKLPLQKKYATLYQKFNSNVKRNLKKAQQNDFYIHDATPSQLIKMYQDTKGKTLQHSESYYSLLEKLMYQSRHHKQGVLYGVYNKYNDIEAGGFFLYYGKQIINLFPASSAYGRSSGAMFVLINEIITQQAQTDQFLDFEGSMVASVARFYQSWGAQNQAYWSIRRNNLKGWRKFIYQLKSR